MQYYTKIPFWENTRRINKLTDFRALIPAYFNGLGEDDAFGNPDVSVEGLKIRQQISRMIPEINLMVMGAGTNPNVTHFPAPTVGGYVANINVITNLFNLDHYDILPIEVLDQIDHAIGVYEVNKIPAFIRTFNPFFWAWMLVTAIASLPFKLLSSAGFDGKKAQQSFLGKLVSFIIQSIIVVGTLLSILQILGYTSTLQAIRHTIDSHVVVQQTRKR